MNLKDHELEEKVQELYDKDWEIKLKDQEFV